MDLRRLSGAVCSVCASVEFLACLSSCWVDLGHGTAPDESEEFVTDFPDQ